MARGRKKGKQSGWTGASKADRYGAWLRQLNEAKWELGKANAASTAALAAIPGGRARPSNIKWKQWQAGRQQQQQQQQPTRFNGRAAARFLQNYLSGPPLPSAHALTDPVKGRRGEAAAEEEEEAEEIDLEAWLMRERRGQLQQRVEPPDLSDGAGIPESEGGIAAAAAPAAVLEAEEEEGDEEEDMTHEEEGGIPSLTTLCCLQVGQDLPLYAAAAAAATAAPAPAAAAGEADDAADSAAAAEAILALFDLLPNDCLERISLAASEEGAVDDAALPLLCQPSVRRLVLVGRFTEQGLARWVPLVDGWTDSNDSAAMNQIELLTLHAPRTTKNNTRAMYPRLQTAATETTTAQRQPQQQPQRQALQPGVSWEDEAFEPQLEGCIALDALLLSSPALHPDTLLPALGRHLPTLRHLALPQCFNARVTTTCREVLVGGITASLPYVQELDLRGCNWVSEKGLLGWAGAVGAAVGGAKGEERKVKPPPPPQQQQQQGPPPALRRLVVDARLAGQAELVTAFAGCERAARRGHQLAALGLGEKGPGPGIALVSWEGVERES